MSTETPSSTKPWWDREPELPRTGEASRDVRALLARMVDAIRPELEYRGHELQLPPTYDITRLATAKRADLIQALLREADIASLQEVLASAKKRHALGSSPLDESRPDALGSLGLSKEEDDIDAANLPDGPPGRSHALVTPSSRDLDVLELIARAAKDAGMDPESGAV